MFICYIAIFLLCLYGIEYNRKSPFHPQNGCLSRPVTDSIKGIFILIVFFRHIHQNIRRAIPNLELSSLDNWFLTIDQLIRQLLVVMFLFYSGYGVMEAIKNKGQSYIDAIPRKRIMITYINYAIAVSIFIIGNIIVGIDYSTSQNVMAYTIWQSIGQPTWYIFCILSCYGITYISFKMINNQRKALIFSILLGLGYITIIQYILPDKSFWYDTVLAYNGGLALSLYISNISEYFQKYYMKVLIIMICTFVVLYYMSYRGIFNLGYITPNLCGIAMAYLIVIITMRIRIHNKVLRWLGKNLFPIYMYHLIPITFILAVVETETIRQHIGSFIVICFIITLGIAYFYPKFQITDKFVSKISLLQLCKNK